MRTRGKEFSIEKMAEVFQVSVTGYYSYIKRDPSSREKENNQLKNLIIKLYREGRSMYGSLRIHGKMKNMGIDCLRKRVAKLIRKNWKKTTKQGKKRSCKESGEPEL